MLRATLSLLLLALLASCKHEAKPSEIVHVKDTTSVPEKPLYLPVTDLLKVELNDIDTLPVTPLKIVSVNGKDDSTWLKKKDIRAFARPFLTPVIDSAHISAFFTERSFMDETINAITFSYEPKGSLPDTMTLKKWNVYLDPERNTIIRIFMVKEVKKGSGIETQQLLWQANRWCKITYINENATDGNKIREEKLIWDFRD